MPIKAYDSIEKAIKGCFGEDTSINSSRSVIGGDINTTQILSLSNGDEVFVKINTIKNKGFFDAEEEGLAAIAGTDTIGTPKLYCKGTDEKKGISFLMMEPVKGVQNKDTWLIMGHEFADMHMAGTVGFVEGGKYGFIHDNYIGATKQINTPKENWIDFFRECRLEPQIRMAQDAFDRYTLKDMLKLMDGLDDILIEPDNPSLLHGDMWGGNHMIGSSGRAILIDPAVYVGHSEADMAFTELFGSMPRDFYRGYYEKIEKQPGYEDRKDLYNLYHLLNHYNLFGGSYLSSVIRTVRHYI